MSSNNKIIVITGPTASGKTEASVELSKHLNMEVISADSRQIYKYLDIGTAKPDKKELAAVKHHFVDFLDPAETYSAGKFGNEAAEKAHEIINRGKTPVLVGGSGLYIKAMCEGLVEEPESEEEKKLEIREKLAAAFTQKGGDHLYNELKEIDPDSAEFYIDKNPRRILRALEYYRLTGEKFSDAIKRQTKNRNFDCKYFGIVFKRDSLYERINQRVRMMWDIGLVQEVRKVLDMGYSTELNSLNTVGYKETISYINKEIVVETAISEIQKNTRRYAKRQMTWLRSMNNLNYIEALESGYIERIIEQSIDFLNSE